MGEYTYDKYLEQWEIWIGEGDEGVYGKHFVTKLDTEEFTAKLAQLEALSVQIDELQKRDDYTLGTDTWRQCEKLMGLSYPLEVALFV